MEKNIKSIIESLLYVAGQDGIEISELKRVLEIKSDEIRAYLKDMKKDYESNPNRGLTINNYGDKYFLLTKTSNKDLISKLFDVKIKNPLSSSLLETLAIIAYNAPCPGSKVEQIRGHSAINQIERLIKLDLIKNVGRATTPGCPYLYDVTPKFFSTFGIKSIKELPDITKSFDENNSNDEDFFASKFSDKK
ncbi:MAG: SMC-Scp complex subunit ScpB [Mycoplasma sp.]